MIALDTNLLVYAHRADLWSADRDFNRFGDLAVRNPLLDSDSD